MAPDAREATLHGASATARAIQSGSSLWLIVNGLPRNDTGSTMYVLWRTSPGQSPTAVTTFDVTRPGTQTLRRQLPTGLPPSAGLAVSYEPGRRAPAKPTDVVLAGSGPVR